MKKSDIGEKPCWIRLLLKINFGVFVFVEYSDSRQVLCVLALTISSGPKLLTAEFAEKTREGRREIRLR